MNSQPSLLQQLGYTRIKTLGSGNYGTVIEYTKGGQSYAIKRVPFDEFITQTPQELNVMAQVKSPYLMNIEDFILDDKYIYLVMKKGIDFEKYLKVVKLSPEQQIQFMWEMANGLNCLHSQGFFHCDLKLANMLYVNVSPSLTEETLQRPVVGRRDINGSVVITDLGLAGFNPVMAQEGNCATLTERAPELLKEFETQFSEENHKWLSNKGYGHIADVWSLGVVFASMLAGGDIFYPPGSTVNDIVEYIDLYLKHPYEYLKRIGVPEQFIPFIVYILNPDVNTRPTTEQILQHPIFEGLERAPCDKYIITVPNVDVPQEIKNRISQIRLSKRLNGHTIHQSIEIYKRLANELQECDQDLVYTVALQLAVSLYENNTADADLLNITLGYKDYFDFLRVVISILNGVIGN